MLLSIITHHRNDNYMGGATWRIETCLNKWGLNLAALGATDVEVSFTDWGSRKPLLDVINLNGETTKRLNHLYVDPAKAKAADRDSEYSAVHATNKSARRSTGRYFMYLDIDVYFSIDTMQRLLEALRADKLGDHDLSKTFFWGSRHHIPKEFNDTRPTHAMLDEHIRLHRQTYKFDKVNNQDFCGAATALLVTKDMWHAVRGVDERLRYWGVSDIDIHKRLRMKYQFGGDLEDHGLIFYHLEHYSTRVMSVENPRRANDMTHPTRPEANDENWGASY